MTAPSAPFFVSVASDNVICARPMEMRAILRILAQSGKLGSSSGGLNQESRSLPAADG